MPTYAYACTTCEHRFEVQQSFSDDALTECPECQGRLRKLFNSVGIVFKGSGFYRTDSRNGKTGGDTAAAASTSSTSSGSSDSSSTSSTTTSAPSTSGGAAAGSSGGSSTTSSSSSSNAGSAA